MASGLYPVEEKNVTLANEALSKFEKKNVLFQIAILIVYRGYTMEPPSPPFECAHMW